jgi:acyl dehydratase
MSEILSTGKITPEAIHSLREKIGLPLRSRNSYNTSSCYDSVRHYCLGIGDDNPLWYDKEYGKSTVLGGNLVPPSFLFSVGIGVVQMGFPGVHGFHGGSEWTWFRPIRHGEDIRLTIWLDDVVERSGQMGGRSVVNYYSSVYYTPDNEVVAYLRSWTFRIERDAMRDRGKETSGFSPQTWSPEEIAKIEAIYDNEKIRGSKNRYWEDVEVGQELDPIVKGPLCLSDMIAFYAGVMVAPTPAHKIAFKDYQSHPKWWFRNPENGGLEPVVRVHENLEAAHNAGVPAPYDVGIQRHGWLVHLVTNWMGDSAFLLKNRGEYRAFNYFGDVQYFTGRVERKFVQDGEHCVELSLAGTNQRGKVTIPGTAIVALPSRHDELTPVERRAGTRVDLDEFMKTLPVPVRK